MSSVAACLPRAPLSATRRRPRTPPTVAFTPAALLAGVLPGVLGGLLSTAVAYPLELAETHLAAAGKGAAEDPSNASGRRAPPRQPLSPSSPPRPRHGGATVKRVRSSTLSQATAAAALSLAPSQPVGDRLLDRLASGMHAAAVASVAAGAPGTSGAAGAADATWGAVAAGAAVAAPKRGNPLAPTAAMLGRLGSPSPAGLYTGLPLSLAAAAAGWAAYFAVFTVLPYGSGGAPVEAAVTASGGATAVTASAAAAATAARIPGLLVRTATAAVAAAVANAPFIRVRTIAVTQGLTPGAAAEVAMDGVGVGGLWSGMGLHVAAMAPVVVQGALFEAVGGGSGGVAAAAAWGAATAGVAAIACYPLVGLRTRAMASREGAETGTSGGLGWDDGLAPFVVRSVVPTAVLFGVRCGLGG